MSLKLDISCGSAFKETIESEINMLSELMTNSHPQLSRANNNSVIQSYKKMIATRREMLNQLAFTDI